MKIVRFNWDPATEITIGRKNAVESSLRNALGDRLSAPCHAGMMTACLMTVGASSAEVKGTIACSCGKIRWDVSVPADGDRLSFVSRTSD